MQNDPKALEIIRFLDQKPRIDELESYLKKTREYYKSNLPYLIQTSNILKQLSSWMKKNLSTIYSNNLFKFIVRLYQLMGFGLNADVTEYYRSHERALSRDPKFLSKSYLEGFDLSKQTSDNLVDNPLLEFNLFHFALSIINQVVSQEDAMKYKPTILVLVGFISIYSYDRNFFFEGISNFFNRECSDYFKEGKVLQDFDKYHKTLGSL